MKALGLSINDAIHIRGGRKGLDRSKVDDCGREDGGGRFDVDVHKNIL